jgi:hypothetical protein
MRLGGPISFALHVGFAVAGMIAAPYLVKQESSSMMILPVDIEIADSTNVVPVTEDVSEEDKAAETPPVENFAAANPPPAAADEEILPDETKPEPKKPDPKKAEAEASTAPAPKKEAPKSTLQSLNDILKDVDRSAAQTRADPAPRPSMRGVTDAGARQGAGDQKRMTARVADIIMSQLLARGCWGDQDDMADARRLGAVIAVQFGPDRRIRKMELIEPRTRPTNDPPLQVFIQRAYDALNKCNNPKYQIPDEYFQTNPPAIIELNFKP